MDYCVFTEPHRRHLRRPARVRRAAEEHGFTGYFRSDHYLTAAAADGMPGRRTRASRSPGSRAKRRDPAGHAGSPVTSAPGTATRSVVAGQPDVGRRSSSGYGVPAGSPASTRAYGIPFPCSLRWFDLLEEQLEIVTGLWRTPVGESYGFEGEEYRLVDAPALPKPVQDAVPIIVGGGGPRRTPDLARAYASELTLGFLRGTTRSPHASDESLPRAARAGRARSREP